MSKRKFAIHNKSDKPDNIVYKEQEIIEQCIMIESQLPSFMIDYFLYLKNAVALSSRLAYLEDVLFFCKYLINETNLTKAGTTSDITIEDFNSITSRDINNFIGNYCARYILKNENSIKVMENNQRTLSRKKSSLSVLFKYLYRDEVITKNITDGFNPIKLPKPQPDAIKRLDIDEVVSLLDLIDSGELLNEKEKVYWEKTKYRDRAIFVLFLTYGLRVSELHQLNLSSFNFHRGEFKIYRKRGKEVLMPLNKTCEKVIKEYIEHGRPNIDSDDFVDKDALFLSLQKKRMTIRAIRNLSKKYTSLVMGLDKDNGYSPHKLRATAATSLIQQGFSIYDVQNLLDHDNVTTTQLYAAHKKDVKREIVKNFEWLDK
ncbi:tyrosine-type recombinase/integrase [Serpentinicella alkaliphila]|uniref:Site-specific recombinase XerD n=1 Tax=Serpentinicella alkaliphila TaxID=1734049 RepID=A0A4R2TE99_9FIRM|nr:tyrosine-type recombinase/integrase [Serpentinicella alkaliphila]QUH26505.1 tyrosine-type recombinase/integrase [Serpentinicella alkaliphila]TCP95498.1 site-specific recombinase XerD [Serpentinicella alkaliphila]